MVLEFFGKKFTEYELASGVNFSYKNAVSIAGIINFLRTLSVRYYVNLNSNLEELLHFLDEGYYPIVLINPGLLYFSTESEHAHYIVIKHLSNADKLVINDPDPEYGCENREIDLKLFMTAWKSQKKFRWLLVIQG